MKLIKIIISIFQFFSIEPLEIFMPVTERQTAANPNPYITEDPLVLVQTGRFHKVPFIIGVNSDEGIIRTSGM